jgi:hypothetical protein
MGAPIYDHNFMLQTMIELQRSFTKVETKVDRLIQDVGVHGDKIDGVRGKINFVQGAAWAIGGLLVVAISLAAVLIKTKWLGG